MTANQINYAKLQEDRRHNAAQERLSRYGTDMSTAASRYGAELSAGASRYATQQQVAELQRHNMEQEGINRYHVEGQVSALGKQAEAALQQATTGAKRAETAEGELAEGIRHNVQSEEISKVNTALSGVGQISGLAAQLLRGLGGML